MPPRDIPIFRMAIRFLNGFSGLFYAELDGKTTWWQIEEGHCDYYGGPEPSHYERPQSFAANEEGLWATNNSQISYGITVVYKSMVEWVIVLIPLR